jgi:hypothetical protein
MNRQERSDLLERLVDYRRTYHLRGAVDTTPILTVAAVVHYAETLMRAARIGPATSSAS